MALAWTSNPVASTPKAATPSSSTEKPATTGSGEAMVDVEAEDGGEGEGGDGGQDKEEMYEDEDAEEGWKR